MLLLSPIIVVMLPFTVSQTFYYSRDNIVVYEYEIGTVGTYYFQTKNNETFVIEENGQFGLDEKRAIYHLANENGASFVEREMVK
ncbi:hypothetical protein [Lysinibacillus sp. FJAT-14222]|uniref:hypothetical protein n=1 Tax=Lysinibacillus sp. FJAT-14222 TaxID=1932366 RepID=UPI0006AF41AE|nr:hypothetical protein [Lysinibacillus sp. FJAT-14222]